MVFSWTLLIVAGAVIVSMVALIMVCLDCRNKGPLVSIRQVNTSEYMPSNEFRIIHPSQPTTDLNSLHPAGNSLSPFLLRSDPGTRRHRSFTPAETESNQSYENPTDGLDNTESNAGEYLIVLPPSRASTPSSDVQHDYENVERVSTEETDYLNVKPESGSCHSFPQGESSAMTEVYRASTNIDNNEDDDDDDDDDDEDDEAGNYVNVNAPYD